jgi:hypothetical protein
LLSLLWLPRFHALSRTKPYITRTWKSSGVNHRSHCPYSMHTSRCPSIPLTGEAFQYLAHFSDLKVVPSVFAYRLVQMCGASPASLGAMTCPTLTSGPRSLSNVELAVELVSHEVDNHTSILHADGGEALRPSPLAFRAFHSFRFASPRVSRNSCLVLASLAFFACFVSLGSTPCCAGVGSGAFVNPPRGSGLESMTAHAARTLP